MRTQTITETFFVTSKDKDMLLENLNKAIERYKYNFYQETKIPLSVRDIKFIPNEAEYFSKNSYILNALVIFEHYIETEVTSYVFINNTEEDGYSSVEEKLDKTMEWYESEHLYPEIIVADYKQYPDKTVIGNGNILETLFVTIEHMPVDTLEDKRDDNND